MWRVEEGRRFRDEGGCELAIQSETAHRKGGMRREDLAVISRSLSKHSSPGSLSQTNVLGISDITGVQLFFREGSESLGISNKEDGAKGKKEKSGGSEDDRVQLGK